MDKNSRVYDHNAWLATQERPQTQWEAVDNNGQLIHIQSAAMQPTDHASALAPTGGGSQMDDATTIAKGTLMRSLPIMAMFFLLAVAITFLGWGLGVVGTFAQGTGTLLLIWGGGSLWAYRQVAQMDHDHSHYGVERRKVEAAENIALTELESRERMAIKAIDSHVQLTKARLGVRDDTTH